MQRGIAILADAKVKISRANHERKRGHVVHRVDITHLVNLVDISSVFDCITKANFVILRRQRHLGNIHEVAIQARHVHRCQSTRKYLAPYTVAVSCPPVRLLWIVYAVLGLRTHSCVRKGGACGPRMRMLYRLGWDHGAPSPSSATNLRARSLEIKETPTLKKNHNTSLSQLSN